MGGKNKFGSDGRYASILKEVVYPVVERNECQKKLRTTRLGRFFELDKSFICAGGIQGVDTCKGDGGSPLTCKIQGRNSWVQRGIVSWGSIAWALSQCPTAGSCRINFLTQQVTNEENIRYTDILNDQCPRSKLVQETH